MHERLLAELKRFAAMLISCQLAERTALATHNNP